ncbi:YggS family pyridoxal phosphate-dependent enzyme [Oscillospiraceae bacterium PP1C4]
MMTNELNSASISDVVQRVTDSIVKQCALCGRSPSDVRLMAVTKTVEAARVNEAIAAGVTLLGENKAQELCAKYDDYEKDGAEIHFIGHLQSNKVRQIVDKVTMIQSLDSISLAAEIQRQCVKLDRKMDCLIEVNIGNELTKSGVAPEMLPQFLAQLGDFDRLSVRGIMAIPPVCQNDLEKEHYFSSLHKLFIDIEEKKIDNISMHFLSMGMSDDYLLAIKHGSNLVRLGSVLFGRRNYAR